MSQWHFSGVADAIFVEISPKLYQGSKFSDFGQLTVLVNRIKNKENS